MGDIIQANYEQLAQVAERFGLAAEASAELRGRLMRDFSPLEAGGWVGRGSAAFCAEMHGDVFPAMDRLIGALLAAQQVTLDLRTVFQRAEEEAAAPLRGMGVGSDEGADGGKSHVTSHPQTSGSEVGPLTSGPFKLGPPQRPDIQQDNGFLDKFPPREPTLADRLRLLKWRAMLEGSEAMMPQLADANAAYRHFLDGNGADRQFDYERYIADDPSGQVALQNIVADAQEHAETLGQGRNQFSMTSDIYPVGSNDPRYPYPQTENWQKAIGYHPVWTSANVQVSGSGADATYTMTLTLHVEDRYNFNPGAQDIATGIPDSDNGVFEVTGLAHQYTNYSEVTRVVTWKAGNAADAQVVDTDTSRNRRPADNRRIRNQI
jgi:WXG100 family type VII secretion target